MTLIETIVVSFITVCVTTPASWAGLWIVARMNRETERQRFVREKLHERYGNFVTAALGLLDTAKIAHDERVGACPPPEGHDSDRAEREGWQELNRLAFHIQLLEPNKELVSAVKALVEAWPHVATNSEAENLAEFGLHIDRYEALLNSFTEAVMLTHSAGAIGKAK